MEHEMNLTTVQTLSIMSLFSRRPSGCEGLSLFFNAFEHAGAVRVETHDGTRRRVLGFVTEDGQVHRG